MTDMGSGGRGPPRRAGRGATETDAPPTDMGSGGRAPATDGPTGGASETDAPPTDMGSGGRAPAAGRPTGDATEAEAPTADVSSAPGAPADPGADGATEAEAPVTDMTSDASRSGPARRGRPNLVGVPGHLFARAALSGEPIVLHRKFVR